MAIPGDITVKGSVTRAGSCRITPRCGLWRMPRHQDKGRLTPFYFPEPRQAI